MCAEKLKAQQNRAHRKGFHIAKLHKMKAFNIRATAVCVRMKAANSVLMLMMLLIMNRSGAQDTGAYLGPHNAARDEVGVGALQWDDTVAAYAKNYASQRAGDCALQHSGGQYGENIFWGGTGNDWQPGDAVASWVGEKQYYDYDSNACTGGQECGHYTQVVWSQSQRLGCASVTCDNDAGTFIICNYDPPGNVAGQKPY